MRITFTLLAIALLSSFYGMSQTKVKVREVGKHYGETITICDKLLSDNFLFDTKTKNYTLTLGTSSSDKVTVVVPTSSSKNIIDKPQRYANRSLCVTGKVTELNGRAEIIVNGADDIRFCDDATQLHEIKPNDFMSFE